MKIVKDDSVIDLKTGKITEIKRNEKIMTVSIVVPEDFSGHYCRYCPIYIDEGFMCDLTGICPLQEVKK